MGSQGQCDGFTDAFAGACDQRDFVFRSFMGRSVGSKADTPRLSIKGQKLKISRSKYNCYTIFENGRTLL